MTPAELDAEAMRRKTIYRSLDRHVTRVYSEFQAELARLIPLRDDAERDYNVAVRLANLARGRVGAVGAVLAAVGALGDPVAALLG